MNPTTYDPSNAATRPAPDCPTEEATGLPLDNGTSVLIGQNRYYHHDGSYETHNGFEPIRVAPPADEVRLWVYKLAYHRTKFRAAEGILRHLRAVLRPGTSFTFTWDDRVSRAFGPAPRTAEAAESRMALVTEWHASKVRALEAQLHQRGIDPEGTDV